MVETFLINILILVFPVLLFVLFIDNNHSKYKYLICTFFSSVTMVLCMFYPIVLENGMHIDLRLVPFLIEALYGSYKGAFPLYIILNIYRFFIGGEGTLETFFITTVLFLVVPLISRKFNQYGTYKRIATGAIVSLLAVLFTLITLFATLETFNREFFTILMYSMIIHLIVSAINIVMIEKIYSNIKNRELFLHTEKLYVMSEISASVSHEIRNPLTVTKGFLQLLGVSKTISQKDQMYIDYSLKELVRAETILNNYLAFAKPQSIHMVHADLKEDMEYVTNILTPFAKINNVDITYQFSNSLMKKYDQNQMKQCLINLLKNAIESMKEEGGVLSIHVFEQSKNMVIRVEDEGIGMTKQEILQLGKPFYSTKTEGTGLGMMMVYGTISKLKGEVEVHSKKGKGTTFTITIPT